ncbi:MAG TPA: MotA/TolQ/ExbB proton channel family protein [Candidatus Sumerlaeota bacterium]|nr:MAG: Biopolymer transport protein ExbB [candidate division BRC1 bacterium ADurb.BinA292]HOE96168.1 MotA/TolQ/ExbB proton channel family protein [Candidatus Sumerlaeota bacterium]HOR28264.1 MotA/TolQ/ExbB proton channel family protein [Candidatus Sumerlaeota bacterium]HPK03315.1 MotA/TolQ/ExbB proton channel family protein [Candidatus Sumerlaeota bacterium]
MKARFGSHPSGRDLDYLPPASRYRIALMFLLFLVGTATIALAQTAPNSNLQNWIGVDPIAMLYDSDIIGQACLIILAGFSIISWMVIVYKYLHIRQASTQTDAFVEVCNQGSGELEEAFRLASNFPDSPLAQILREGYLELEIENWYRDGYDLDPQARLDIIKVSVERVFERTITSEINHLESKLVFLATTSSVCPFIGLFGTVWGIMGTFQTAMSGSQAVALSSLAPGISTALLTTVGGLFCAIPASVMYNYLTHRVRMLISRMDAFALELGNVVQKQVMKQGAMV